MAKKYKYSFAGKKEAREGKGAIALSALALALFFASMLMSYLTEGHAGMLVGAFGLFSFLSAIYGFCLGMSVWQTRRKGHMMAAVGSITSGLMAILWLTMFLMGLK